MPNRRNVYGLSGSSLAGPRVSRDLYHVTPTPLRTPYLPYLVRPESFQHLGPHLSVPMVPLDPLDRRILVQT